MREGGRERGGWIWSAAAAVLAIPAMAPLAAPGLIGTHRYGDSPFLLVRLVALLEGLRRGELQPRWSPELSYGLGYPFFDFYGALAYQVAAGLHLAGLPAVESLKAVQALVLLAASLAAFALARRHVGDVGGLVAAAAYGYAPYHLVNAYARGDSLGELTAMAILPALLLAVEVAAEGRLIGGVASALLFGLLILSHNLSALLGAPIVALWALAPLAAAWRARRIVPWRGVLTVGTGLAAGVGLTTYYWLPVLYDRRYITFQHNTTGYFDFRGHFLAPRRLVQPSLVYDYGLAGTADGGLPFQVGLAQALLAIVGLAACGWWWAAGRRGGRRPGPGWGAGLAVAIAGGYLALTMPLGRPLWELAAPLQIVQFPWRLLAPASLGLALLAALPAGALRGRARAAWAVAAVGLAVVGGGWGATPERWRIPERDVDVAHVQQYEYLTSSIGSTVRYEYLPLGARERPWTSSYVTFPDGGALRPVPGQWATVEALGPLALAISGSGGPLILEHHYFPGWRASVGGVEVPVAASDPEGYLVVEVPNGQHRLDLAFGETRARRLARYASLAAAALAVVALAIGGLVGRRPSRGPADDEASEVASMAPAEVAGTPMVRAGLVAPHPAIALVVGLLALAVFAARAPWAEWRADPPDDGWSRRFAHEHAPWPYQPLDGAPLGTARVLAYRQPAAIAAGEGAIVHIRGDGQRERVAARLVAPAEAIAQAPRTIASAEVDVGPGQSELWIAVPTGTPPGLYQIELAAPGGRRWLFEPLRVERGTRTPPALGVPLATFGGELALHAVAPTRDATAARPNFELRWRSARAPTGDWRVSTRLVDEGGRLWASSDGRPIDGFYPTRLWVARELVVERRDLPTRPGTPPGLYRLEVRVYSLGQSRRELDATDARGQVAPLYRSGLFPLAAGPPPEPPRPGAPPLEWLEARVGAREAEAGTEVPLELLWRANAPPGRPLWLVLRVGAAEQRLPADGTAWRPGELVAAQPSLRVPLELASGEHPVSASLVDTSGSVHLGPVAVGGLRVRNRPRAFGSPAMQRSVGALLGEEVELLGYDLAPGAPVRLTLYWRATSPPARSLTVFTHLLDGAGRVRGQVDQVPGGGAFPTDGWAPGEVVTDRYEIALEPGAPAGPHRLEVGLYDARSGERVPVRRPGSVLAAGADHLILASVDARP